jgi:hypothetical protein
MRPGKRFGLSAVEKSDVWKRWKDGQSLHEIGRAYNKPHTPFAICCCLAEGFLHELVVARASRSPWLSEKIYLEGSVPVHRFVRLLDD